MKSFIIFFLKRYFFPQCVIENFIIRSSRYNTSTVLNKDIEIPRKKFLLFRHNAERNNPEGNSPLKSCFIPWKYKTEVENFQSIGISRDMGGLPVFYMPPEYMEADAPDDKKAFFQYLQNAVLILSVFVVSNVFIDSKYFLIFWQAELDQRQ